MAALVQHLQADRFVERDDDALKIFDAQPGRTVIEDLQQFTRRTGTPDLWRWHLHTKPTSSRFVIIAEDIAVPESKRTRVGMAPCPLCSLNGAKFYNGMLVWFPDEKALRVIGNECAKRVAGAVALTNARRDFRVRRADDKATSFIIDNLPNVRAARPAFTEVQRRARQLDRTAKDIRGALRPDARRLLLNAMTGDEHLGLFSWSSVAMLDRRGMPLLDKDGAIRRTQALQLDETVEVRGLKIFALSQNCESYAVRACAALDGLIVDDDDAALEHLGRLDREERVRAAQRIEDAWSLIAKAIATFDRMAQFLAPDNIEALGKWGRDRRAATPVYAAVRAYGRVEIGEMSRKAVSILPNRDVGDPLPYIPDLIHGG